MDTIRVYEREKLYKEVWKESMTTLAKQYGVSDVALRKQCKKMDIPLPKAGHWAKVKAGKKIKVPPLPKYDGRDKIVVTVQSEGPSGIKQGASLLFLTEKNREYVKQYCSTLTVPRELTKPHGLIRDTKQYHRSRKESTRPPLNRVINMKVSDEQMERTYKFYDTLFKSLEHLGYTLEIRESKYRQYRNRNELLVCLNEDSVPISIKEKQKRVKHKPTEEELESRFSFSPSYDYLMTGNLHFEIDSYHAKRKNWNDTKTKKIENQIGEIIIWIMNAIHSKKINREKIEVEKARQLEEQLIRQEIEERKEDELKRLEQLNQYANDWEKAEKIRKFADAIELKIMSIDKEEEKEQIENWLKSAREKADLIDPLVEKRMKFWGRV